MLEQKRPIAVRKRWAVIIGSALAILLIGLGPLHLAVFNASASMPTGLYVRNFGPIGRHSIVEFCPPEVARKWLEKQQRAEANAQWSLTCPHTATPFIKEVAAIEGDTVVVKKDGVHVNGEPALPGSRPLRTTYNPNTKKFSPLPPYPRKAYILKKDEVWAYTPLWSSFDSRYYGPVVPIVSDVALLTLDWNPPTSPPPDKKKP